MHADDALRDEPTRPEDTPRQLGSLQRLREWWRTLPRPRERRLAMTLAVSLVLLRSSIFVFFDAVFDSDQAIVGLMAKHLGEGRALPVFTYGQDYQLAIEAWLAAPLFWLFGTSIFALKFPLLVINVVMAALLVRILERELTLRPLVALVVASPFVLAPPGTTVYFLEASGGQVEPLFIALLLWLTRRSPLTFGVIFALGFLQRVFTVYAVGALLLVELLDRSLLTTDGLKRKLQAAVSFAAVWHVVGLAREYAGTAWGPATSGNYAGLPVTTSDSASLNVSLLLDRFCFDPVSLPASLVKFSGPFLSTMFGGHREPLADLAIPSLGTQGVDGLWWLLGATVLLAAGRIGWTAVTGPTRPWHPQLQFATYLIFIGLQSSVVYVVSQCGLVAAGTMRYTLMTVLGVIGILAYHVAVEPNRHIRRITTGVVALWAVVTLGGHTRLLAEFVESPPSNNRRVLADYLTERDIRYGHAYDFWDVYSTMFFADERVILSSPRRWFIQEYEWLVQRNRDEAVWILREPCDGGEQVTDTHWVCPPEPGG